jgi:phage shock protein A
MMTIAQQIARRAELRDLIEALEEQYGDMLSQHRAEIALAGDSWPGACLQLDEMRQRIADAEAELNAINGR